MTARSQFTIRDEGKSLLIRAHCPTKIWERLSLAIIAAIVISLVGNESPDFAWWPVIGILFGTSIYWVLPGARRSELRISGVECYSRANFGKSLSRGRLVLTADILWLEYNEQGISLRDEPGTRGLFAVRRSGSVCLLPLLDGQQTGEIIAAIENKFSGLAGLGAGDRLWENPLKHFHLASSRSLFEGAFDEGEAALGLFAQKFFLFAAFAQTAVQFVGDSQRSKDRCFLRVHGGGGVGDGAHFFIHIGGKFLDVGGIEIAGDGIGLAEDLDSGRRWHSVCRAPRTEGKLA